MIAFIHTNLCVKALGGGEEEGPNLLLGNIDMPSIKVLFLLLNSCSRFPNAACVHMWNVVVKEKMRKAEYFQGYNIWLSSTFEDTAMLVSRSCPFWQY